MNRSDATAKLLISGANCAQSVLCTFVDELGLDIEQAMRAATQFGGGMAASGQTCGAVTAALIALGAKHGTSTPAETKQSKYDAYRLGQEFIRRFLDRKNALTCGEILGCSISTPEAYAEAQAKNLFVTKCLKPMKDAVEILEQML